MAENTFPWSPQDPPESSAAETQHNTGKTSDFRSRIKQLFPLLLFLLLIALLFVFRARPLNETATKAPLTDVLVTMLALPKGSPIAPETLRLVSFDKRSLTKKQLLTVVLSQDVEALRGRILSKKDIPPNQILFWDDIELLREVPKRIETKIYFPLESP